MRRAVGDWQAMIDRMGKFSATKEPLTPEALEQLRALGYVD